MLHLKGTKEGALIDFLTCYPSVISEAAPTDEVSCGFVDNGMIDISAYSLPYYTSIIRTYKKPLYLDMETIAEQIFDELFNEQEKTAFCPMPLCTVLV